MKKLFPVFVLFLLILVPFRVFACPQCEDPSSLSYHYRTVCNGSPYLNYSASLMLDTVSAPIYDIHVVCNGTDYLLFLSSGPFSGRTGATWGNGDDATGSGFSSLFSNVRYRLIQLKSGPGATYDYYFDGWYSYPGSFLPYNYLELDSVSESSILAIDTTDLVPRVLGDGSFYEPPVFDPFSAEYDDDVPVPQVITKFNVVAGVTTPIISFTNGSTDYNLVIYGRWNSINDVTLRQEKLRWVYDYSSLIHGDLECWVSDEDNRSSRENFDFFSDPHFTDTYQAFLLKYPLADRNITNDPTLFEKLTGYNEALHNFTELYMNLPNNAYSKPDFFFRYYYRDEEQNIHYSRWAHLTFPLIPPGENGFKTTTDQLWKGNLDYQIANKPLTSEEVLDVDTYFDTDQTKYNILNNQQSYDLDQIDWTMSLDNLQSLTSVFGQMPAFVATVFSCYPSWMVQMIGATITILCALAIYHGIRG